jgi:hemoglobin-like flavoprotein
MNHRQIELVRGSLSGCADSLLAFAADLFHRRLFFLAPALRARFDGVARRRNAVFALFVRDVAGDLDRLDRLAPRLVSLARRMDRAGVSATDYAAVRAAFCFAMRTALFDTFTFRVRTAWRGVFDLLAGMMQRAVTERLPAAREETGRRSVAPTLADAAQRPAARSGTHRIVAESPASVRSSAPPSVRAVG